MDLNKHLIKPEDASKFFNWCIYGPPGSGKTAFCADAPDPFWEDFEESSITLDAMLRKGLIPKYIDRAAPMTLQEAKDIAEEVIKSEKYQTLVIDTVTRFQWIQMMLDFIPKQKTVIDGKRDRFTTYQADFGYSTNILDDFFFWLVKQPINVIMVAHAKSTYKTIVDQGGGMSKQLEKIEPDVTPALRDDLTGLFSLVGYMTNTTSLGGSKRKLRVNGTNIITAKNRYFIQEQEIENPTIESILNHD